MYAGADAGAALELGAGATGAAGGFGLEGDAGGLLNVFFVVTESGAETAGAVALAAAGICGAGENVISPALSAGAANGTEDPAEGELPTIVDPGELMPPPPKIDLIQLVILSIVLIIYHLYFIRECRG
jgi:hypothetical protein